MSVDTRPIPVTILRWPRTRDLITQHKFIYLYLWANPAQTACGCYLLPIDALAAEMSMTPTSLADALDEFERRQLVQLDRDTGEIWLPDWFRWYQPRTPAARGAVESAILKILSAKLREKIEKSYETTTSPRKGKEKEKVKDKAAAADGNGGSKKCGRIHASGIMCWNADDERAAERLHRDTPPDILASAIRECKKAGKQAYPSYIEASVARFLSQPAGGSATVTFACASDPALLDYYAAQTRAEAAAAASAR